MLAHQTETLKAAMESGRPLGVIHKQFSQTIKGIDESTRSVDFIISTGDVDRDNDIINPKGWKLQAFRKNPVVLWAHDSFSPPIARAENTRLDGDKLVSTGVFPEPGVHDFADTVFGLLLGKFLRASSVGFNPLETSFDNERGGFNFQKQELHEWSVVPVPANPQALIQAKDSGINIQPVLAWCERTMDTFSTKEAQAAAQAGWSVLKVPQISVPEYTPDDIPDEVTMSLEMARFSPEIRSALIQGLTDSQDADPAPLVSSVGDPLDAEPEEGGHAYSDEDVVTMDGPDSSQGDNDQGGDQDSGLSPDDVLLEDVDPEELRSVIASTTKIALAHATGSLP